MKKTGIITFLGLSLTTLLFAGAPDFFNYQGKIHQATGQPATNGSYDMVFSIYSQSSGGSALFSDTRSGAGGVPVVDGNFSVLVGTGSLSGQPLAQALAGPDRWLQVTVAGVPLLPRQKLASVPYALAIASASVASAEVLDGSVGTAQLANGAIRSSHIPAAAVTDVKISSIAFSKITNVPASAGGPTVYDGPSQVLAGISTFSFTAGSFIATSAPAGQANVFLSTAVTLMSNSFNTSNRLLLLNSTAAVPTGQFSGAYTGITGVGALTSGTWQGTPFGTAFGGTGGATAAQARANLGMASTATAILAGDGLTGGGNFTTDRTISVSTAGLPAGGCSATGDKLVWSALNNRLECGADSNANTSSTGGDLTGVQTAVTVVGLQTRPVASTAPALNEVLTWNGASWWPSPQSQGPVSAWSLPIVNRTSLWQTTNTLTFSFFEEFPSSVTVLGSLQVSGNITGPNVTSGADPGHSHSVYASSAHVHALGSSGDDADITSGVLPILRGGTNNTVWAYASYVRGNLAGTALEGRDWGELFSDIDVSAENHTHPGVTPHGGAGGFAPRFNGTAAVETSTLELGGDQVGINGIDPWSKLTVTEDPPASNPTVWVENTTNTGSTFQAIGHVFLYQLNSFGKDAVRIDVSGGTGTNIGLDVGIASATAPTIYNQGIWAITGDNITGFADAVRGEATGSTNNYGVYGRAFGSLANGRSGMSGFATDGAVNYGLYATASGGSTNWAGYFQGDVDIVNGALSKVSGTFDIPHPDPARQPAGWRLRHSFVESPTRGDNIYRWTVQVKGGKAEISLPDYFPYLNENAQVIVSARRHLGQGWGRVDSAQKRVTLQADVDGSYNVMVIATRKDKDARVFDEKGVEYQGGKP